MVFIVISLEDNTGDGQPKTWCYAYDRQKADHYYALAMDSLEKFLNDTHEENCEGGCEDDPREYCTCNFRDCDALHEGEDDGGDCKGIDDVEEIEDWVKERLTKSQPEGSSVVQGVNGSCGGEWLVYVAMLKVPVWRTQAAESKKRKQEE